MRAVPSGDASKAAEIHRVRLHDESNMCTIGVMTAAAFSSEPVPPGDRPVPAALAELFTAMEQLDLQPLAADDDALADVLLGLTRAAAKLDAITVPVASAWDARGAWGHDGSKSARARLARESWDDPKHCGTTLRRSRGLRSMPLAGAAFEAGRIGADRVDVLVRANASHRAKEYAESEAHLVSIAETVADFDDFARTVRYWIDAADDASSSGDPETRARRQRESRGLDFASGLDGVRFLNGRFDAIDGDIVDGELRRLEQQMFEADWAEARERYGDDARADQLPRTARQRRADALVEMATRSKSLPDGSPLARPLISVLVDYPTLNGAVRELFNGTVLTAGQVASLLAEADLERIVFEGASRVLDVGVRTRMFRGATRRAVEVRDRRCSFPGCTVPAEWCQVDHIIEYTDGGLTTQDNGRLLCPRHNRQRPGRRPRDAAAPDLEPGRRSGRPAHRRPERQPDLSWRCGQGGVGSWMRERPPRSPVLDLLAPTTIAEVTHIEMPFR